MLLVRMINKRIKEYFISRSFISSNGRSIDSGIAYNSMFNMLMLLHYDDGIDKKKWKQNKVFIMDVHDFTVRHVSRNTNLVNTFFTNTCLS